MQFFDASRTAPVTPARGVRLGRLQTLKGSFAGFANGSDGVSIRSQFSRSFVSTLEQFGEQIAGFCGCFAALGSVGIGGDGCGLKSGNPLAQPASSIGSRSSGRTIARGLDVCSISGLLNGDESAVRFGLLRQRIGRLCGLCLDLRL